MNYETKRKITKFLKSKWKWFLGSGIFLLAGLIVMLIGFSVTGWSIVKWLQSRYAVATFICVIIGAYLLIMGFLIKKRVDLIK